MVEKRVMMKDIPLDVYRDEIKSLIQSEYCDENLIQTQINSLSFYYRSDPTEMLATVYEPSICIILQGAKEVGIGEELIPYDPDSYLLASVHVPARVRIAEASAESPYIGLTVTFTMEQIFEVMKQLNDSIKTSSNTKRGLYFGEMETSLLEPVTRLVRLLKTPEDIPVLSPMIIKEILYIVMRREGGEFIRQYVKDGSTTRHIVKAINKIKDNFKETINMKELAKSVGMSESSLYHNFKKVTAMSPLQFQKNLRLHEARQILLACEVDAAQVAFDVGYESPSQFSREYSRLFGLPPKTDVQRLSEERS